MECTNYRRNQRKGSRIAYCMDPLSTETYLPLDRLTWAKHSRRWMDGRTDRQTERKSTERQTGWGTQYPDSSIIDFQVAHLNFALWSGTQLPPKRQAHKHSRPYIDSIWKKRDGSTCMCLCLWVCRLDFFSDDVVVVSYCLQVQRHHKLLLKSYACWK